MRGSAAITWLVLCLASAAAAQEPAPIVAARADVEGAYGDLDVLHYDAGVASAVF